MRSLRVAAVVAALALVAVTVAGSATAALAAGSLQATRATVGMVSSARQLASEAGVEALRRGGNAVDAAAVTQFVLNVVEPYASGIGGGCFILIYDARTQAIYAIDGREEAPALYHERVFLGPDGRPIPFADRSTGGMPVGVPGTLAAWALALERFGTFSLAEALEPAIRIAEEGFVLTELDAQILKEHAGRLARFQASAKLYLREDGTPLEAGTRLRNPDLAETFRLIAREGIRAFYEGPIADDIVRAVREAPFNPGVMSKLDLQLYRPVLREPVRGTYRGYEVVSMGPPTSGGAALIENLNLLEAFDLSAYGWGSVDAVHLLAEAQKVAFADRNRYLGDADYVDIPLAMLLSKPYAARRRALIQPFAAIPTPAPFGTPEEGGVATTHFSVVDKDRNMVAVTSTIEQWFGAALVVPGRGFLLNNELTDFDAVPTFPDGTLAPNRPEGGKRVRRTALGEDARTLGGKRPRSSMTPTLVFKDGKPYAALGSPGGSRIFGIVLNVLTNMIDFGMDPQQAITAPRIVNRNGPTELEPGLFQNPALVAALAARGHDVRQVEPFGGAHAVVIDPQTGQLLGGADPRRGGYVAGY